VVHATPGRDLVTIVEEAVLQGCGKSRPQRDSIPGPYSCMWTFIVSILIDIFWHPLE